MLPRTLALFAAVALAAPAARAEIKLHQLFTDHMVLQQKVENNVWGTAAANEKVTVTLTKGDKSELATATADGGGKFTAKLPAAEAGTGYTLTVAAGSDKVTLNNVAVGEVWVCSGQSNMEWRFNLLRGGYDMAEKAVNKNIRLFTVPNPDDESEGKTYRDYMNPDSRRTVTGYVEPAAASAAPEQSFQFERTGYFVADRYDHTPERPVFNRSVTLRDTWATKA